MASKSQGPNNFGTFTDDAAVGTIAWTNPSNAQTSNNVYAAASLTPGIQISHYLRATNLGFTIPLSAKVDGIIVGVERKYALTGGSPEVRDNSVRLYSGGAFVGADKALAPPWTTSDVTATYGGATDKWGVVLTPEEVNSSGFGFGISAKQTIGSAGASASIDYVYMTVYYTECGFRLSESVYFPVSPYFGLYSEPRFAAWTPSTVFTNTESLILRLGSNGSVGSFKLIVSDPGELYRAEAIENHLIHFLVKQGPIRKRYLGVVDTANHVESRRYDGGVLKVTGYGYGAYLRHRNLPADFSGVQMYNAITDMTTGLASKVPEITFGNYVKDPGIPVYTTARQRTVADVLEEFMVLAGTATNSYTFWICQGDHATEWGIPNCHFREKTYMPSPVVFTHDRCHMWEDLSTFQFLKNAVEVEYGAGSTLTRNDLVSQGKYGTYYKYVYAPFLTTFGAAQEWADKILNRTVNPVKAVKIAVPLTLTADPNYTARFRSRTFNQMLEISTVELRFLPQSVPSAIIVAGTSNL